MEKKVIVQPLNFSNPQELVNKTILVEAEMVVWSLTPIECQEEGLLQIPVVVEEILDSETAPNWHKNNYAGRLLFGIRGRLLQRQGQETVVYFWYIKNKF